MRLIEITRCVLTAALFSGCASTELVSGPKGPEIVTSGYVSERGQYAEVGVQFSSPGDFVALFSPSRWRSPVETGGALSWANLNAWKDDGMRTSRILFGQAILVGGLVAAGADGGGGRSNGGGESFSEPPPPGDEAPSLPPGGGGASRRKLHSGRPLRLLKAWRIFG